MANNGWAVGFSSGGDHYLAWGTERHRLDVHEVVDGTIRKPLRLRPTAVTFPACLRFMVDVVEVMAPTRVATGKYDRLVDPEAATLMGERRETI